MVGTSDTDTESVFSEDSEISNYLADSNDSAESDSNEIDSDDLTASDDETVFDARQWCKVQCSPDLVDPPLPAFRLPLLLD